MENQAEAVGLERVGRTERGGAAIGLPDPSEMIRGALRVAGGLGGGAGVGGSLAGEVPGRGGVPSEGDPDAGGTPAASVHPYRNTGCRLTSGTDGFHFTFPEDRRERIAQIVSKYFGPGEMCDRGINTYQKSERWETGAILAWTDGRPEAFLKLPGEAVAFLGERVWEFVQEVAGLVKCTRVDTYVDDHSRQVYDLEAIHRAGADGNYYGARTYDPRRPRRVNGELEGNTAYFGRRGSSGGGTYTRVYDKHLESGGVESQIRHEVEWSGKKALVAWEVLANAKDFADMCQKAARLTIGAITFVERGSHVHRARMRVLPWWQRVIDAVGEGVVVKLQRVTAPLSRALKAFKKQWVRTLALAIDVIDHQGHDGEGVIVGMLRAAKGSVRGWRRGARDVAIDLSEILGCAESRAEGMQEKLAKFLGTQPAL